MGINEALMGIDVNPTRSANTYFINKVLFLSK